MASGEDGIGCHGAYLTLSVFCQEHVIIGGTPFACLLYSSNFVSFRKVHLLDLIGYYGCM